MPASNLRVTLTRSVIGSTVRQKATVKALGLRRIRQSVELPDNGAVRGMIFKVRHLLEVEAVNGNDGKQA